MSYGKGNQNAAFNGGATEVCTVYVPVQLERQVEPQPLHAPVRLTAPVSSLQNLAEAVDDPIQPLARQAAELRVRSPWRRMDAAPRQERI